MTVTTGPETATNLAPRLCAQVDTHVQALLDQPSPLRRKLLPCAFTINVVGCTVDDVGAGVQPRLGAADFPADAADADVTLFV